MLRLLEAQRRLAASILADDAPASWGISVYRGNVFGNWSGALAIAYPIVRKIVGAEFFDAMARHFARAHTSRSGDLHDYGAELPDFLAGYRHTADLPYLPDVARMEWFAHRAYYAPEAPRFDPAMLADQSPERLESLRLKLAPSCTLLHSRWPLARLWEIHQDDFRGDFSVDLHSGPDRVVIHRPRWQVSVQSVLPGEFRFLRGAEMGETLGEALETAASADAAFDPCAVLPRWIPSGVLSF
jgi:uncharacterized protein